MTTQLMIMTIIYLFNIVFQYLRAKLACGLVEPSTSSLATDGRTIETNEIKALMYLDDIEIDILSENQTNIQYKCINISTISK